MINRRFALALVATALCGAAGAQTAFPSKPLRLVVGFAPGGAADSVARVIAQALGKQLGQQVIVENKPGADGILAAQEVQRAAPDGHTLLLGTNTALVAVPSLRPNPPYDPFKAFTPISSAGQFSMFLLVNTALPVKTVAQLLEHVAANPGKLNSASSNSAAELAMLQLLGERKVLNVRYKGDVPALTDLVGNNIHMIWTTGTSAPAFVKDGRARALLTLQPQRSPLLPDVPTATEAGLGTLTIKPWAGFFGPAGMPAEIVNRLSAELGAALQRPEVREQLAQQGFDGLGMTAPQFTVFFKQQYDTFNTIVREHNVKFDQ
ncbi:MAG: tripartite tricarboxylate transporter substrate binding protein [Vitreoscilla sp.]|nr:tripartite tricarboxylate transporter substrate binding protein [Vitreoscilla sp.]